MIISPWWLGGGLHLITHMLSFFLLVSRPVEAVVFQLSRVILREERTPGFGTFPAHFARQTKT